MGTAQATQIGQRVSEARQESASRPRRPFGGRLPSLRWLIILIVVLPIAAVAAALVSISILTSRSIAEQLGRELVQNATGRVITEVKGYIGDAVRLSDLYTRRIESGRLSTTDMTAWEPLMFEDLATNPNVASICFANLAGDSTYLDRTHNRLELGVADGKKLRELNNAIEWPATADGKVNRQQPIREYHYDALNRPWYITAMKHDQPVWTDVYFWFGEVGSESETGTGYTRKVYKGNQQVGVLAVDVTLSAISDFLRRQPFSQTGAIFILDDQGLLVAASEGQVNSPEGQRLPLNQSDSPAARAVATLYPTTSPTAPVAAALGIKPAGAALQHVEFAGQSARVSDVPLRPYPGADWRIITVLPESAFLAQANAVQRRSILFGVLAIVLAMVVGLAFSRRLSEPMMRLTAHAARIGQGDLNARLELGGARELQQLAEETNRMAAGLKQRMELEQSLALATHVQQSLLPQDCPELRGLEIAAHSRYCDSTGGDYYDFIDVADLPQDRAFVAVGDVMGHGVGSALVMATARAAVRASAASGESTLGQLMGRVNDVLSSDPHGLFMTMALVVVEPHKSRVRWASAGHDPVIAYDPRRDHFIDLEGGDIPLGVTGGYPFQDFAHTGIGVDWVLFIGTDGVWEARNESLSEMYGKERLRECIRENRDKSATEIARCIERSLAKFVGGGPVLDDITFVLVKVVPDTEHTVTSNPSVVAAI